MANVSAFTGAFPVIPGGTVELGYLEKTSTVSVNAGSGSQVSVIGPLTIVTDGSPLMVEFFCEEAASATTAGAYLLAALWVDGAENTRTMGVAYGGATGSNHGETLNAVRRVTLAAGSHTIEIKGWSSAAANFYAGAGGTASYAPMFLRVSKIVNQNDGLKPFWTPPVVTQLPSQATVGDQVVNYTTNGAYQPYFYTGATDGWKQVGTSKPPMCAASRNAASNHDTSGSWLKVTWDTEEVDTDAMFSASSSVITINTTGVYAVAASVGFGANTTGARALMVGKNGGGVYASATRLPGCYVESPAPSTGAWNHSLSSLASLTAGDTVEVFAYQNSGSSPLAYNVGSKNMQLSVAWIGKTT